MVQQTDGKRIAEFCRDIFLVIGEIPDHFIDAVDTDGGEMVLQPAEVTLGERIQPIVHQALDDLALDFQAVLRHIGQTVQTGEQGFLIALEQITKTGAVDGDNPDGTGLFR